MTLLDSLIAVLLVWGFYRGRQRGVRAEVVRIISLLIVLAFLLGYSLFSVIDGGLTTLADSVLQRRGIAVTVVLLVITLLAVITFRKHLNQERKYQRPGGEPPLYGGIVGILRALLLVVILLSVFSIILPEFLNQAIVGDSLLGHALELMRGLHGPPAG